MAEQTTRYGSVPGGIGLDQIILDITDTEAFLIRKSGDGGDVFTFDSSAGVLTCEAKQIIDVTNTEALLIRKDSDGGDVFNVDTASNRVEANELRAAGAGGLKLYDDGGTGLFIEDGGNIGVNEASPGGQLHVSQSAPTGAKPTLVLEQLDIDENFFKFVGKSSVLVDRALVDAADFATIGALKGYLKVYVEDTQSVNPIVDGDYYIPFYAVPTA